NRLVLASRVIQSLVLHVLDSPASIIESPEHRLILAFRVVQRLVLDVRDRRSSIIQGSQDALPLPGDPLAGVVLDCLDRGRCPVDRTQNAVPGPAGPYLGRVDHVADDVGREVDRIHDEIDRHLERAAPTLAASEQAAEPRLEPFPLLEDPVFRRLQFLTELVAPFVDAEIVEDRGPAHEVPGRAGTITAAREEAGQPVPETVPLLNDPLFRLVEYVAKL